MVRYSFLVRLSHPLLHAGLSRRIFDYPIGSRQHIRRNCDNVPKRAQTPAECLEARRDGGRGSNTQESDPRDFLRLLPLGWTAERKHDERYEESKWHWSSDRKVPDTSTLRH